MEKKKQENKMRRDQLNDQYLELLDQQRLYFKTVKDFKEVHKDKLAANANPDGCRAGPGRVGPVRSFFTGCPLCFRSVVRTRCCSPS